jgi:hypothetical protein
LSSRRKRHVAVPSPHAPRSIPGDVIGKAPELHHDEDNRAGLDSREMPLFAMPPPESA